MKRSSQPSLDDESYRRQTLRPLNCLVFILVPLAAFHLGAARFGTRLMVPYYFDKVLRYFGATSLHLSALLIVAALLAQHLVRRDKWRLEMRVLAGMLAESIIWSLPVIALSFLLPRSLAMAASPATQSATGAETQPVSLIQQIIEKMGAGVYEEFFFRLVLISVIMLTSAP